MVFHGRGPEPATGECPSPNGADRPETGELGPWAEFGITAARSKAYQLSHVGQLT
jgi:hypothetical protein